MTGFLKGMDRKRLDMFTEQPLARARTEWRETAPIANFGCEVVLAGPAATRTFAFASYPVSLDAQRERPVQMPALLSPTAACGATP